MNVNLHLLDDDEHQVVKAHVDPVYVSLELREAEGSYVNLFISTEQQAREIEVAAGLLRAHLHEKANPSVPDRVDAQVAP